LAIPMIRPRLPAISGPLAIPIPLAVIRIALQQRASERILAAAALP
jgi:hypothetical protein